MLSLTKHQAKELCYNRWQLGINEDYPIYAQVIKDMIVMREDRCTRTFSNDDCKAIINFCCTI